MIGEQFYQLQFSSVSRSDNRDTIDRVALRYSIHGRNVGVSIKLSSAQHPRFVTTLNELTHNHHIPQ